MIVRYVKKVLATVYTYIMLHVHIHVPTNEHCTCTINTVCTVYWRRKYCWPPCYKREWRMTGTLLLCIRCINLWQNLPVQSNNSPQFFLLFRLWPQPVGRLESPRVRSVSGTYSNKCVGRSSVTMNITLYALISPGMIDFWSLLVSSLKFSIIF